MKGNVDRFDHDIRALHAAASALIAEAFAASPNQAKVAARLQGLQAATAETEKYFSRKCQCKKG